MSSRSCKVDLNETIFALDKQLAEMPVFRLAVGVPLTIAIVFLIGIWVEIYSSLCLSFRLSCVNNFFGTYKVPIGFFSLSVILGTLAATLHRSAQMDLSIKAAQEENEFDICMAHEVSFENYLRRLSIFPLDLNGLNKYEFRFEDPSTNYTQFFPNNAEAVVDLTPDLECIIEGWGLTVGKIDSFFSCTIEIVSLRDSAIEKTCQLIRKTDGICAHHQAEGDLPVNYVMVNPTKRLIPCSPSSHFDILYLLEATAELLYKACSFRLSGETGSLELADLVSSKMMPNLHAGIDHETECLKARFS